MMRLPPERLLVLRYLHSVEGTPVEGHFRITPERTFQLVQTRFTSVATGLPTASEDNPERLGEWFTVNESISAITRLRFLTIPENELQLQIGPDTLDIGRIQEAGVVELEIRRSSLGRWWQTVLSNRLLGNP
jgi:hypothetical protein